MIKKLIPFAAILLLFTSCILTPIEEEEAPAYVGTWSKISFSNDSTTTSIRLAISENSYSVYQDILIKLTATTTSTEMERGTLSNPGSTSFTLTQTHLLEDNSLMKIPTTLQNPRSVVWSVFVNELSLVDTTNAFTNGSFSKQ